MEEKIKKTYTTSVIICVSIIGVIFIYAVIIEIIRSQSLFAPIAKGNLSTLKYISFISVPLVFFAAKKVSASFFQNAERPAEGKLNDILTGTLINAGLFEIPALLGFVFFFVAGAYMEFYALAVFSIMMEIANFPKYRKWKNYILPGGVQ